jgi:predicted nucleic-acid-binding protein
MKALDTNILVRFLVADDEVQAKKVRQLFKTTEKNKDELFVTLLVLIELIWVLESVYSIERKDIINAIDDMLQMSIFKFELQTTLHVFTNIALTNKIDLSDLLISLSAKRLKCETTLTFDKKASNFEYFSLL